MHIYLYIYMTLLSAYAVSYICWAHFGSVFYCICQCVYRIYIYIYIHIFTSTVPIGRSIGHRAIARYSFSIVGSIRHRTRVQKHNIGTYIYIYMYWRMLRLSLAPTYIWSSYGGIFKIIWKYLLMEHLHMRTCNYVYIYNYIFTWTLSPSKAAYTRALFHSAQLYRISVWHNGSEDRIYIK